MRTALPIPGLERRQRVRRRLAMPAKIRCDQAAGRYLPAVTRDLSATGACLDIHEPGLRLATGQQVHLVIADHPRQAVLRAATGISATVVRSVGHGPGGPVAVRFDHPVELALAG